MQNEKDIFFEVISDRHCNDEWSVLRFDSFCLHRVSSQIIATIGKKKSLYKSLYKYRERERERARGKEIDGKKKRSGRDCLNWAISLVVCGGGRPSGCSWERNKCVFSRLLCRNRGQSYLYTIGRRGRPGLNCI